jgi:fumarate reductase subunit C
MTVDRGTTLKDGWAGIERERRLDRWVGRICAFAWGLTFLLTAVYAVIVSQQVLHTVRLQQAGAASGEAVMTAAMPLVVALGILALLVATLSTVGMFLRFRTAALGEIQLRLAALERVVTGGKAE